MPSGDTHAQMATALRSRRCTAYVADRLLFTTERIFCNHCERSRAVWDLVTHGLWQTRLPRWKRLRTNEATLTAVSSIGEI